ncbi:MULTISPECIES: putative monovalent cation/H+ antiporter subunit A [unclassified Meridianimarinicoccus]|uniref:putative monovalent cation/H+ antiporter subunit A n=1 Tax=unclassified Meridianimarinicoccus TaxID=2923344 RepID=UPI001865A82D|nr:putative monovalent cation/H+ antiporter subunit A [Fluviibacterium sp. MJW13]
MAEHDPNPSQGWTAAGYVPPVIAAGLFLTFLQALPTIAGGGTLRYSFSWIPSLSVDLSFFVDGLSLTFALLISGIGVMVMLFSGSYLKGHPQHGRFSLYLVSFMLAMLGLVLSDNMLGLFVFWELTTITSYLLIGFSHTSENSRRSALQALFVTGFGGLAMLAGFLIIAGIAGTMELSELRGMGDILRDNSMYGAILVLILLGAFTKSAQVPFHFWLPNAMAAPTPVSAYLHSATMVKGGVYLLARMHPTLSGTDAWLWSLTIFGAVTAVFASIMAIKQTDLKQTLAYTTLMALGTLVMFLASPNAYAITAVATFLVVHSLYKAALFLVIGCVDHATGTRDARRLGGLMRQMPVTTVAAGLAALSMAGVPPFIGFIGKELLYKGGLESPSVGPILIGATLAASALMFAAGGIVALRPFWGSADKMPDPGRPITEAPWPMLVGPVLLSVLGLLFGLVPHMLEVNVTTPLVAALLGDPAKAKHLHLWAGVNAALILSLITFAIGILLYLLHTRLRDALEAAGDRLFTFDGLWDGFLARLGRFARWQGGLIQSGILNRYLTTVFIVIALGLASAMIHTRMSTGPIAIPTPEFKHLVVFLLTFAGTALTIITNSRISAIAGLGVVGIGVALIFILFSAPDVAITQLLVEMLVVVLFSVAALRLPVLPRRTGKRERIGHGIIAVSVGSLVTLTLLGVVSEPIDRRLSDFFEIASYPDAYGRNIVNVILVDFRAFDTFGEVSVVAVAALAALALLRQRGKGGRS